MVNYFPVRTHGIYLNNLGPYEYTMRQDTDLIDVTTLGDKLDIDPEWFHIDENGHFHAFNMDNQLTPTLKYVTETIETGEWLDSVTAEHRCIICNVKVEPNYIVTAKPPIETVPGMTTTTFDIRTRMFACSVGEQVSFYSGLMFGFARVTHISVRSEHQEITFQCEFLARRGSNGNL